MSFKVFARWVRSWLRVRGLRSPHLFPLCSGGQGGLYVVLVSAALRLHYLLQLLVVACPSSSCSGLGVSRFVFLFPFLLRFFSLCFFSLFVFMRVPA